MLNFNKKTIAIKALLFISGFATLSLQILGIRILAPFFGTSTPVWTALIGVVIAGSAVGYYGGGALADHVQKKEVFLWLAGGASMFIILILVFREIISIISPYFPYGLGAFTSSVILFFVPAIVLSSLTTYAIRIFVKKLDTIGQIHGILYATATMGGVVGIFGNNYLLLPFFNIVNIIFALSILLFLFGLLAFLSSRDSNISK